MPKTTTEKKTAKKINKKRIPYQGQGQTIRVKPQEIDANTIPRHRFSIVVKDRKTIIHPYYFKFNIHNTSEKNLSRNYAKSVARKTHSQIESSASILKGLSTAFIPSQESDKEPTFQNKPATQPGFEAEQNKNRPNNTAKSQFAPVLPQILNIERLQPQQQENVIEPYRTPSNVSSVPTDSEISDSGSLLDFQQQIYFYLYYNHLVNSQYNNFVRTIQNGNAPSISNHWSTTFTHSNAQNVDAQSAMVNNTISLDNFKPT